LRVFSDAILDELTREPATEPANKKLDGVALAKPGAVGEIFKLRDVVILSVFHHA
jgi:hypothetical protein